jgi:redox-sensitive bicupin YhaK (pirin superfamily)
MLTGRFMHEDFKGHKGIIGPGDLQWMTAGRGIMHSEVPVSDEPSHGLQLWVNLASKDKMVAPAYQELLARDIPKRSHDGVTATVIAGEALGVKSPVYTRTPTMYLDFKLAPGATLKQPVPEGWNGFAYVLEGEGVFGGVRGPAHHTLVLSNKPGQDGLVVTSETGAHFVLICGQPIGERVVQHGPFVMTTEDEIRQAMMDFRSGRNGFEGAAAWESEGGASFR